MKILLFICSFILASHCWAYDDDLYDISAKAGYCPATPAIWQLKPKPKIYSSNNLRRRNGSAYFAKGEYINIIGRLTDSNCVPISGAVVEIWQLGGNGSSEGKVIDKHFTGSGSIITDNKGMYTFFTVMPNIFNKIPVHINIAVTHQDFNNFSTIIFLKKFDWHILPKEIKQQIYPQQVNLLLAKHKGFDNIDNTEVFEFNININEFNKYRSY